MDVGIVSTHLWTESTQLSQDLISTGIECYITYTGKPSGQKSSAVCARVSMRDNVTGWSPHCSETSKLFFDMCGVQRRGCDEES